MSGVQGGGGLCFGVTTGVMLPNDALSPSVSLKHPRASTLIYGEEREERTHHHNTAIRAQGGREG